MFKNFKKYPKAKKIRTVVIIVLVLGLAGFLGYEMLKPDPLPEYELITAEKGSINQTYTATGTVESGNPTEYKIIDGVEVLEVKVKVGDKVKKGDLLATFNTDSLSSKLSEVRSEYNQALSRYNEAASTSADSSSKLREMTIKISELETQISKLKRDIEKTREKEEKQAEKQAEKAKEETAKYTGTAYTPEQIAALSRQILENGGTDEQVASMIAALNSAEENAKNSSENLTADQLADKLKDTSAGKSLELIQLQTQLTSLETQKSYYELQSGDTLAKAFKSIADVKEREYLELKDTIAALDDGWHAEGNGIVTQVNIVQGEVYHEDSSSKSSTASFSEMLNMVGGGQVDLSSILSQFTASADNSIGIKVDNYDQFIASFNVGKYDLLSLEVGQKAKVYSLDSEYDAVVDYVSATASENTGLDISSITSSLTGGTNSSSSALAKVKILNPDEKIIIGFDVDISVNTGEVENAIELPVESLRFDNGEKYVFVYNEETKTVEKRNVELGVSEETKYQILSGLKEGEKVVKNPLSALNDGDKINIKK